MKTCLHAVSFKVVCPLVFRNCTTLKGKIECIMVVVDRRRGNDRRRGSDRRSGQDSRKLNDPRGIGAESRGSAPTDDDPKCQRCAACLRTLRVLILECPFPDKKCLYKQNHEIIHYVTYPSARLENKSAVVASSPSHISSYSIILIRPDPIIEKNQIYYIDVTDSHVP